MRRDLRGTTPERLLAEAGWLRRIAVSLVGEGGAADDLVQETWIAALKRSRDDGEPPREWLAAVLRNFGRQRMRSEASRRRREERTARGEALPSPEELVFRMEQQRLLAEAITRLDEPYRSTVILRYTDDLAPSEIARLQGLPPGTVRRRLKVGLDRLRADLDRRSGGRDAWVGGLLPVVGLRPEEVLASTAKGASVLGGILVMKKLVAVLVALLIAAGLWNFTRGGATDESVAGSAAAPTGLDAPSDVEAEPGAAGIVAEEGRSKAAEPEATLPATDDVALVRGRVELPKGCEADPTLEVFALDRSSSYRDMVRRSDLDRRLLASARVAADGAFELSVPATQDFVHLALRGRYLYTRDSTQVEPASGAPVELVPSTGAWITGRTVPPEADRGADLAGDTIFLGALAAIDPGTAVLGDVFKLDVETDADGGFELRAVPTADDYTLIVAPHRWAAQRLAVSDLSSCATTSMSLVLEAGQSVRGTVLDETGAPVPNAWVDGYLPGSWFGFDDAHVRRAVTRGDGTFELEALPVGTLMVRAGVDGRLESEKVRVELGESPLEGVVLRLENGAAIDGGVAWPDGSPARGAFVEVEFDRSELVGEQTFNSLRGAEGAATSDESGRFRVAGLGAGPFTVKCEVERDGVEFRARADGVRPGAQVELALHAPVALAGRVTGPDGRPVPRFRVQVARVVDGAYGAMGLDRREQAFLSETGEFVLQDLAGGVWELAASGSGFVTVEPLRVTLPFPTASSPVVLRTVAAAAISGVVFSSSGYPVAAAVVRQDTSEPSWLTRLAVGRVAASARTDATGRFLLEGLVPGTVAVLAESREHGRSAPETIDLAPGMTAHGIELRLTVGGAIAGEVLDDQGRPAPRQVLTIEHLTTGETSLQVADSGGRFTFRHLEPGTWQVIAIEPHHAVAAEGGEVGLDEMFDNLRTTAAEVAEGETTHVVLGGAAEEPVTVSGSVRRGGEAHAGAWILFLSSVDPRGAMKMDTTADDGRYEVTLDRPGDYVVSIQRPGSAEETIDYVRTVPAAAQHRIDFDLPAGRIAGRILAPSGEPAAGARVALYSDGVSHSAEYHQGEYCETAADEEGRYEFAELKAGVFTVMAGGSHPPGAKGAVFARTARGDLELPAGGSLDGVDFRLPGHGAVEVRVLGESLEPAPGVTVFARGADGEIVDPISSAATDATGRCVLDGLAEGAYTLLARGGGRACADGEPVHVSAGSSTAAQLRVVDGTMLRIALRDTRGRPVHGWGSVHDEEDRDVGGMYPMAEIYELYYAGVFSPTDPAVGPLPPGTYRVEGTGFGGLEGSRTVTLRGEPERETTVVVK